MVGERLDISRRLLRVNKNAPLDPSLFLSESSQTGQQSNIWQAGERVLHQIHGRSLQSH